MKKFLVIALSLFVVGLSANAQRGGNKGGDKGVTPEESAKKQTEKMTELLSLTDKQKPLVSALNLKYAKALKTLRNANSGDREAMRTQMKTQRTEQEAEFKKILSEEQFAKYKKIEEERRQKRGGKGGKSGGGQKGGGQRGGGGNGGH
ncbi:DUF4890 domain-containing protein [bacterium]|nr:DUF4890 domain-containing protein [bacterium]